ncbi:MAG: hypothetical protein WAN93_11590 [Solirubrobacteraceae bacterium]
MIESSDTEEVDALPVLMPEPGSQQLVSTSVAPKAQTAVVAAGGFVVGAVVVSVLGRRHQRAVASRASRRLGRGKRATKDLFEIVGSRSLLVDVHLLGAPLRGR